MLGLGRFGTSLALELVEEGVEVLGVDSDAGIVQGLAGRLTHVVEASILTAPVALGLGVRDVWAKAISQAHATILTQIGVHHVVRPEHDMGKRVAHLVRGRMLDYIELDDGYAFAKTRPLRVMHGKTLADSHVRSELSVTVVGLKRPGCDFTYATADTVVEDGDVVIVSGGRDAVERFAERT